MALPARQFTTSKTTSLSTIYSETIRAYAPNYPPPDNISALATLARPSPIAQRAASIDIATTKNRHSVAPLVVIGEVLQAKSTYSEWHHSLHKQKLERKILAPRPSLAVAITHSTTARPPELATAAKIAAALDCPYWPRPEGPLEVFAKAIAADALLVVGRCDLALWSGGHYLRYHPNAAALRIINLLRGRGDVLNELMRLALGDRVLDCTCGLGADAISAAHSVGPEGHVLALEASPLLALFARCGMASYEHPTTLAITQAMRRVQVDNQRYQDLLPTLADVAKLLSKSPRR